MKERALLIFFISVIINVGTVILSCENTDICQPARALLIVNVGVLIRFRKIPTLTADMSYTQPHIRKSDHVW